jgi:glycosyltransferase involved in cell wall biosynthesis
MSNVKPHTKLKIAVIVNPLIPVPPEQYGGIERIVYMLVKALVENKHDVTLYASEASNPGCKLIPYRESQRYGIKDLLKINLLTTQIAFKNFDLIHTFGRMSNVALLMFSRLPKIVSYQLPPTLPQVKKAVQMARKNTLYFTACSNYIGSQINPFASVSTIYNGIDLTDYQFNEAVTADAPLVFLGRLQNEKGTAIAIEVAKRTGKKLIIAGNIPAEAIHQQYFHEKVQPYIDGKQISYIGPVNNKQKNDLLGNAAALLMPVAWDEPFGIVMTEALACGTPVIGFDRGAIPEVVSDGSNGFICKTVADMVEATNKINRIERIDCRQSVVEKFSSTVITKQYEALYHQVAGK